MPGLALFASPPAVLSAVLAASPLPPPEAAPLAEVQPLDWSLAPTPHGDPPPRGETPPTGEIVVEGDIGPPRSDPMERVNQESYRITQAVDEAVIAPVVYAYRDGLPRPLRDGLGNVVRNLGEPSNALNFLLQGKVGKAFETLGRLAINSTIGVGGLIDVAKKPGIGLAYRRNGFANTLGYYGVGPGPYLYLPVTGATSLRDLAGATLDQVLLPLAVGRPFNRPAFVATYFTINGLDQRLAFDAEIAAIRAADDPYRLRRETYLAKRRRDIAALKGEAISEEDRRWLEQLEPPPAGPQSQEDGPNPAPPQAPSDPAALLITQPR
jgi:phospholipid-binding lipoprotein MlaA